jgi:hypothetical protein
MHDRHIAGAVMQEHEAVLAELRALPLPEQTLTSTPSYAS